MDEKKTIAVDSKRLESPGEPVIETPVSERHCTGMADDDITWDRLACNKMPSLKIDEST